MKKITIEDALNYHSKGRPGKIEVIPTKPYRTQTDLSLAYTPGVAEPCLKISENPDDVYHYTAKGNLVAVVSNGTAVLGLGDIGPLAGKPVMEGKGLLFKVFADVDVFDIEVDEKDPKKLIEVVKAIAPTFGGINLEDIKAPECFEIEEELKKALNIPVFHDDQHGTAIISGAALLNALKVTGKAIETLKVVVNGAGAAAVSCIRLYFSLGVKAENVIMLDSKGVLNKRRTGLNSIKQQFVADTNCETLEDAMKGADLFLGLSVGNVVTPEMVKSMAPNPIVFAMANPTPEISYEAAVDARSDVIMATGRSDYPNQINNVLGFPFIFRGALDVKATTINEAMKTAAVKALAELAREPVPQYVVDAYNIKSLTFGREYLIPKPVDRRLITRVAPAVARAAIESGVARHIITDWDEYQHELDRRLGYDNQLLWNIRDKARKNPRRLIFADATHPRVLRAVRTVMNEGFAFPVLLGDDRKIKEVSARYNIDLGDAPIVDYRSDEQEERRERFAMLLFEKRQRKGLTLNEARELMFNQNYFGMMMVEAGEADAFLSGFGNKYSETIRPALQLFGVESGYHHIAGMYVVLTRKGPFFFADATVNEHCKSDQLVDTTLLVARELKKFNIEPRIAMLSYSNFGSVRNGDPSEVRAAVDRLHRDHPDLIVDGEIQANFALNSKLRDKTFPFSRLSGREVNTLIFPDLNSGNIAYKMMREIGNAEIIGPVLMGLPRSIHVLHMESSEREIVDMAAIAVVDAQ
ncbi:NADP-dependent malic enzyme [Roseimarinus sediminis]|jgi:malate dehydrogenase (oxaloacetate-decarboxylating)(NADP+)|uniref:NADP-dependent malic enzyme n=1 Tax=Roseimarinus sediminis TaxID=1610899 RepID=UPI003D1EED7B